MLKGLSLVIVLAVCGSLLYFVRGRESGKSTIDRASLTTDTQSSRFATKEEAIQFLEPYLDLPTVIEDTAYHIVYHDNSQGVPGPSDWDMKIALKVSSQDIDAWLEGYAVSSEPFDITWGYEFAETRGWTIATKPAFYTKAGEQIAVFISEGVMFKWLSTF
jgi:hypothetical protein